VLLNVLVFFVGVRVAQRFSVFVEVRVAQRFSVFVGVRVAQRFSVFVVLCFFLVCRRTVSCLPNVASISGLSILICPFGFL
jgi:hypothetical protein